jgi:ubiquinone/menaquinone biosynthesis C-methylase UbiE
MTNRDVSDIDPIFSDPRLAAIYDVFDGERDDLPPYLKLVDDLGADSVIDLGCGTGALALLLAKKGRRVVGIDPARASVEVAQSKPDANKVNWIVGDAGSLQNVSADVVIMAGNVAQAIVDPTQWDATLTHAKDVLKPGGYLVFETRNPANEAWKQWNKKESFKSISVPGKGLIDGWVELTNVDFPLVSFRWTYFFHENNEMVASDSTLRFRSVEEIMKDLEKHGFVVKEVREAPDRPGKEHVVIAQVKASK